MKKLLSQIVSAIAGLWLATVLLPEVVVRVYPNSNFFGFEITAQWQMFLALGLILGLLFYFVKPLLKTLNLPFEAFSTEIFAIPISGALLWLADMIFDELYVPWMYPLLYTTLIIWGINLITSRLLVKEY